MKTYSQQQKLAVVRGKTFCLAQQSISHTPKGALSFPKAGFQHGDKQSDFGSVEGQDTV